MIGIGGTFIAVGINGFLVPFDLLEGGAIGIGLILHYLYGFKVGVSFFIISVPIFIIAWFFYRSFFYNGLHGMIWSSFMIDVFASFEFFQAPLLKSPLGSALLGGILIGVGAGLMLRSHISIGGIDLLAQMIAKKINANTGVLIFSFDMVVVTIGSVLITATSLLLSVVTVFSMGLVISLIVATRNEEQVQSLRE